MITFKNTSNNTSINKAPIKARLGLPSLNYPRVTEEQAKQLAKDIPTIIEQIVLANEQAPILLDNQSKNSVSYT